MEKTRQHQELHELLSECDAVTLDAFLILMRELASGGSWREATEKAVDYLKTKPGHERQVQYLLENIDNG